MSQVKPWSILRSRVVVETPIFELHENRVRSPRHDLEADFYSLQMHDWANIIAVTPDEKVLLVEQFRHGIRDVTLEFPGGILNNPEEDPAEAAARELREETGFVASHVVPLGVMLPNPAMQSNRSHFFYAPAVTNGALQKLDDTEDIAVHQIPLRDVPTLIRNGTIAHALMIAGFTLFQRYMEESP